MNKYLYTINSDVYLRVIRKEIFILKSIWFKIFISVHTLSVQVGVYIIFYTNKY